MFFPHKCTDLLSFRPEVPENAQPARTQPALHSWLCTQSQGQRVILWGCADRLCWLRIPGQCWGDPIPRWPVCPDLGLSRAGRVVQVDTALSASWDLRPVSSLCCGSRTCSKPDCPPASPSHVHVLLDHVGAVASWPRGRRWSPR